MPCENVTQLAPFLDFIAAHKLTNYSLYLLPLPSLLFEMNECSNDVQCSNTPVMSYAQIVSKKWTPLDTGGNNAAKLLDIHNSMLFSHACPCCVSSLLLASLPLLRPNNGGAAVAGLWWLRWSQSEEVLLSFDHKSHFPTLPASTQSVSNLICLVILNLLLNLINLVQILSFDWSKAITNGSWENKNKHF